MGVSLAGRQVSGTETGGRGSGGFRPSSRSRLRIIGGVLMSLLAIGTILMIFSTTDKRIAVLQLIHDVPAGAQVSRDDIGVIEISIDPTLEVVRSADAATIDGQFARTRLLAGALVHPGSLQARPLVAPGTAVVAIVVPPGGVPVGLQERSQVQLVFPVEPGAAPDTAAPAPVLGRVAGLLGAADPVTGDVSISIEVATADAPVVAAAGEVRVVLLEPGTDPLDQP